MRNEENKIDLEHSYKAGNSVFWVYNAESKNFIKEHHTKNN